METTRAVLHQARPSSSSENTSGNRAADLEFQTEISGNCEEGAEFQLDRHRDNNKLKKQCILSVYSTPPSGLVDLEYFYKCAEQRHRLLKLIAQVGECDVSSRALWIPALIVRLQSEDLAEFDRIIREDWEEEAGRESLARWDTTSHFVLKVACSRLYESLKWFVKQEVKLFHIRWYLLNTGQRRYFVRSSGITLSEVPADDRIALFKVFEAPCLLNGLYKVCFSGASELVRTRSAYVRAGWVYYKHDQAEFPIASWFAKALDSSCRSAKKKYDNLQFDPRTTYFFQRISDDIKFGLFSCSPWVRGRVAISDLDRLSSESYPLCMNMLHYYLKRCSHLRNGGRLQYNLFLKGIGLSLHDAIAFWRDIFTRRMTLEYFVRHYLYSIRHNYGQLGKLADYPPKSCARIMDANPGPLDRHGCPFKTAGRELLTLHLRRNAVSPTDVAEILSIVERSAPQQACARLFELQHGVTDQPATTHPNIYFKRSCELRNAPCTVASCSTQQVSTSPCNRKQLDW